MVSDNIDCSKTSTLIQVCGFNYSKMLSIAAVNVFEHLFVSVGIITYLDTAKGLKTAYRAFFHEDTITDICFFVCKGQYLGDWRKDTQSLLHFPMKHGIMST